LSTDSVLGGINTSVSRDADIVHVVIRLDKVIDLKMELVVLDIDRYRFQLLFVLWCAISWYANGIAEESY